MAERQPDMRGRLRSRRLLALLKALPLGLALPLVIAAASIGPEDAASNLAKWVRWLGFSDIPRWLSDKAADHRIIVAAIVFGIAYAIVVWGIPFLIRRTSQSSITVPLIAIVLFFSGGLLWQYLNPSPQWRLSVEQAKKLSNLLEQVPAGQRFKVPLTALIASTASQVYAQQLAEVFETHEWNCSLSLDGRMPPNLVGMALIVPNGLNSSAGPPQDEMRISEILEKARFRFTIGNFRSFNWPNWTIAIGLPPDQ
jgi:hypothetical protein